MVGSGVAKAQSQGTSVHVDLYGACLVPKIFQDSPSHRIFRRMHKALNIDKK
jgi:hypothetical protein